MIDIGGTTQFDSQKRGNVFNIKNFDLPQTQAVFSLQ